MIKKIKGYLTKKIIGRVVSEAIDKLDHDTFNDLIDVIKERKGEIVSLSEIYADEIAEFYNNLKKEAK